MSQLAPIFNALRLPATDVDTLIQGRTIAAMPQTFLRPGQQFGLYANDPNLDAGNVLVKAWARCELCQPIDSSEALGIISRLTVWSVDTLQSILAQRGSLWLAYLRVYLLKSPVEVLIKNTGQFIPLTHPITVTDDLPVMSDRDFARLKQQLENLEPPEPLDMQIQRMLEETELQHKIELSKELDWVEQIAKIGNSSGGHEFEKLVRKSFIALGFSNSNTNPKASLDPEATGGAGGIDLCCEHPYPVVGECKASASKKIPTEVCSQLTYLGLAHCPDYEKAIKIIIAAGSLNNHSNPVAIGSKMNVIRPETLEKLVKLKVSYAGSINLRDLKLSLESEPFGEDSNSKLLDFIAKVQLEIKLRSHIIQSVKELMNQPGEDYLNASAVRVQYNAIFGKDANSRLDDRATHELLVELSSPLTGYLGREKSNSNWRGDRFYFLRDLPIEKET
jgi:Domain of unknown function (DUF1802)